MFSRTAVACFALVVVAMASGSAVASASTISGRLTGAKLPARGKGVATVRAVAPKTLAIVRADRVSGGRFFLTVPAGSYFMFGATAPLGRTPGLDRSLGAVKVRKGARRTVRLSLKRRAPRRPGVPKLPTFPLPTARAAVAVDYPAVWQKHFKVSGDPQYKPLAKGMADMLITDVGPGLKSACNGTFVEREKLNFLLAEQLFSQSPAADPATRIEPGKIIAHNKEVTGTISGTEKNLTITATVTDVASGRSRSVTHRGTDGFFALQPRLVPDLIRLLCGDKPPKRYVGTIQGEFGSAAVQLLKWSGNVQLKYIGFGPGGPGAPKGKYANYVVERGSLHVTLDGVDGECTIRGEGDYPLVGNSGEFTTLQQDVERPAYTASAHFPGGSDLPYTSTGPASRQCVGGVYPLSGRVYLSTNGAKVSPSNSLAGSVTVNVGFPATFSWALEPQY